MLIKLADLHRRQRRQTRQPCLVGKVGGFWLMIVDRHDAQPGEPAATLFIGPVSTAGSDNKPLPPVWDAKACKWIGPASPDYPGFYDDTKAVVRDLMDELR
jgi:hypothetical protein